MKKASEARKIKGSERRALLIRVAVTLRRDGFNAAEIFATISVTNAARCDPPLEEAAVRAIAESVAADLPNIKVNNRELRDKAADVLAALATRNARVPFLFARTGSLVRLDRNEEGRPVIVGLTVSHFIGEMTLCANFFKPDPRKQGSTVAVNPPAEVAEYWLSRPTPETDFPVLESVAETPFIRPDGSVVSIPGYDSSTKIFYAPARELDGFEVPARPTADDVDSAAALIHEVFQDFPFVDQASRANAFAFLMTPPLRPAITGNIPLALLDAPQAGTGKTLLAEVVGIITTGVNAALDTAPDRDPEEWRKKITAILLGGQPLVIFDNISTSRPVDSAFLSQALTASTWSDRLLGKTQQVTLPQRCVFAVTGNNIAVGGDIPRRCFWSRIDAQSSEPWLNRKFRHPDLRAWIRSNRGRVLAAILTLARAWFVADRPAADTPVLGSFEEWSRTVGGILAFAGIEGFLGNAGELYSQLDPSKLAWEAFLAAIFERTRGEFFTTADLTQELTLDAEEVFRRMIPDDVGDLHPVGHFKIRLGKAFRRRANVRHGVRGLYVARKPDPPGAKKAELAWWHVRESQDD